MEIKDLIYFSLIGIKCKNITKKLLCYKMKSGICNSRLLYFQNAQKQTYIIPHTTMLSKTLSQINTMSIQIQSCVKEALAHVQQPTKNDFISQSQTDYKLRNVTAQKNDGSSMEMSKFLLLEENQMLKTENMELKQKGREYRSQIKELKKHVRFLESYNDDLKKQVVLWMTRPAKKHQMGSIIEDRFNEYRLRLGDIMSRSTKTSNGNTTNIVHIDSKSQHDDEESTNFHTQQLYTLSQENGVNRLSLQEKLKEKNTDLRKNQFYQVNQKKYSRNSQTHDGECTSCNYLQLVNKTGSKALRKNSCFDTFKKGTKANCMKLENNEIYGNRKKNKLCFSTKNPQQYLCPCHTNYIKTKKF